MGPFIPRDLSAPSNAQRPNDKNKGHHEDYGKVLRKLETLLKDSRLAFMMSPWGGSTDPIGSVIAQLMGEGDSVRIVDLSGVPNEVAGASSSAIARTLFMVKVWQTPDERDRSPVLLVCEEAHRYVPNKGERSMPPLKLPFSDWPRKDASMASD